MDVVTVFYVYRPNAPLLYAIALMLFATAGLLLPVAMQLRTLLSLCKRKDMFAPEKPDLLLKPNDGLVTAPENNNSNTGPGGS